MRIELIMSCRVATVRVAFVGFLALALLLSTDVSRSLGDDGEVAAPHFGRGVLVGEMTSASAIVWTRLSASDKCDDEFHLPGAAGEVRMRYHAAGDSPRETPWRAVDPARDFTHQFHLEDLSPGLQYEYVIEARNEAGSTQLEGTFRTAPAKDTSADVSFVVTTGHKYATTDDQQGPQIYGAMQRLDPDFFVHTGDVVYYDNDTPPPGTSVYSARLHWWRMYSLPARREFHRTVGSYFIKDDHDLLKNDCWPGQTYGELTFDRGVELFREQTPQGQRPYRSVRWGKHLQIWIVEGREYRSPNKMPDGPDKTIWGAEQWRWLTDGMSASDATFKILISPTPIVGPDRTNGSKKDNHANAAFRYEGEQVRRFLSQQPRTFVACGDRHWQYVSEDIETKLREYSCGPSTDAHSGGWKQDNVLPEHRFLRVAGGFLSVAVVADGDQPRIVFRHHDVAGKVVNEETHTASL